MKFFAHLRLIVFMPSLMLIFMLSSCQFVKEGYLQNSRGGGSSPSQPGQAEPTKPIVWDMVLAGTNMRSQRVCYLYLESELKPNQTDQLVKTQYTETKFKVNYDESNGWFISERNNNQEFIRIQGRFVDEETFHVTSYLLNWWHITHSHTEMCEGLRETTDYPDPKVQTHKGSASHFGPSHKTKEESPH